MFPRIHYLLDREFDFKYCSDSGAIEMIIVKSPSSYAPTWSGRRILGHTVDGCIIYTMHVTVCER